MTSVAPVVEGSNEHMVRCEFVKGVKQGRVNPGSEGAKLFKIEVFLKSMGGGHTVVKPFTGGDHKSMYAQVDNTRTTGFILAPQFQKTWRAAFYGSRYTKAVIQFRDKFVDDRTLPEDRNKPRPERRWLFNGVTHINHKDQGGDATVEHKPPVVVHFKKFGFNLGQKERVDWYMKGGDSQPPRSSPARSTVSSGAVASAQIRTRSARDFRGPGIEADETSWLGRFVNGPGKGRKSSPASAKGSKGTGKGSGHTHVQTETSTTPAEAGVLDLQKWAGNRSVAAMLTVSRQPAPVDVKAAPPATDPKFDKTTFSTDNTQFELTYKPNGPMPVKGDATVELRVHIDFKDFTRADMRKEPFRSHRFTRAQRKDFKWTEAEKTKFGTDFQSSVATAWSKKHELVTNEPTFAEHRAIVDVKVELVDAGKAHNTMSALKIPKGKAG